MNTNQKPLSWQPYSVSLETAQEWVTNWIDLGPTTIDPTDMRAFVVHREDFVELLKQQSTEFIRMYIGRKKDEKSGEMESCLLLVSAARQADIQPDAPDPDLIEDLIGDMTIYVDGVPTQQHYDVFDFSHPCPPICNVESPLFIGDADARCA
jgi:hypothetical protein